MATATKPEPTETVPLITEDVLPDIVDPVTPPEALASPPEPTMQQVRDDLRSLARVVDAAMDKMPGVFARELQPLMTGMLPVTQGSLSPPEAGMLQHFCDSLETLGARGLLVTKPYSAELRVLTPQGFPAVLTIERVDSKEFYTAMVSMESWLIANQYRPLP